MNFRVSLIIMFLCVGGIEARADDDFQYWSQLSLKPYKSERFDVVIFTDARLMDNAEKMGLYFISPRVVYHHSKSLDLGINYTFQESRRTAPSAADDSYNSQQRIECEINPQWPLAEWLKLKMRNRFEFRWIEARGWDNTRYRQRWMFEFPLKNALPLRSIYINSEFFYDFPQRNISENRSVPLGLNFKLRENVGFSVFHMIQSQKGSDSWASNQIVGSLISIDF